MTERDHTLEPFQNLLHNRGHPHMTQTKWPRANPARFGNLPTLR